MRYGLLLLLLAAPAAFGQAPAQDVKHLALEANLGTSSFSGDLSNNQAAWTYGLSLSLGQHLWGDDPLANMFGGLASMWSLNFTSISAKTKDSTPFPFTRNKDFNIVGTAIAPTLCALAKAQIQTCFGVGWEEFDVQQSSDNEQIYGTTLWSLGIGHFLSDELHYGVKLNYRNVVQTVAGTHNSFSVISVLASLGWQFRT